MSAPISKAALYAKLLDRCAKRGSQAELAAEVGVSPVFINKVVNSHSPITPCIAKALGYRPVTMFVPLNRVVKEGDAA